MNEVNLADYPAAGFGRRLGAIFYDLIVLLGIIYIAWIPWLLVDAFVEDMTSLNFLKSAYLLGVIFLYLGGFWVTGGQTVGMKAWRLRIICQNGQPLNWQKALTRYLSACLSVASFGLGFIWATVDRKKQSWHDKLSGTHLIWCPDANTKN
ncbi:MAG: RDD family protein [Gammaproteobacteria bacterium]|nr:RDD family protein [Gammaproteobacteria bacterium]